MNRAKRSMPNKLRKKMKKEIRLAQASSSVPESLEYSDKLTAKEMFKKYPKKAVKKQKQGELLQAVGKKVSVKKASFQKISSKRTTPGMVPSTDSAPAIVHKEGQRWIKTLIKQNVSQRTIQDHKGKRKK